MRIIFLLQLFCYAHTSSNTVSKFDVIQKTFDIYIENLQTHKFCRRKLTLFYVLSEYLPSVYF